MRTQLINVDAYRERARRKLPKIAFDFIDGGSASEETMRANRSAFEKVTLRPSTGSGSSPVDISAQVLGTSISMPIMLGPCGMARFANPGGDVAAARAAASAGTIFTLTTMSGHSLEEVAKAGGTSIWYQVYKVGGMERVERTIDRVAEAGYRALVITVDTQVSSNRERDLRNGAPQLLGPRLVNKAPYVAQFLRKPRWLARRILDHGIPRLPNVLREDGSPEYLWKQIRPISLTWEEIGWLRKRWEQDIVVKGILGGDDAMRAVDAGANAVIVSNHGGRQLDCVDPTLRVLPEVVGRVGGQCEIYLDSGIRRGSDVVKAMCLGANAVLLGRAWMYGLAADGQTGIESVLSTLSTELTLNMQLMGCRTLQDLSSDRVRVPNSW